MHIILIHVRVILRPGQISVDYIKTENELREQGIEFHRYT